MLIKKPELLCFELSNINLVQSSYSAYQNYSSLNSIILKTVDHIIVCLQIIKLSNFSDSFAHLLEETEFIN